MRAMRAAAETIVETIVQTTSQARAKVRESPVASVAGHVALNRVIVSTGWRGLASRGPAGVMGARSDPSEMRASRGLR